jgi:hypothetical protein
MNGQAADKNTISEKTLITNHFANDTAAFCRQ